MLYYIIIFNANRLKEPPAKGRSLSDSIRVPAMMKKKEKTDHISKRQNITIVLVGLCAIALNLLLNTVVTAFGLPLYLDNTGTVAVAALGG